MQNITTIITLRIMLKQNGTPELGRESNNDYKNNKLFDQCTGRNTSHLVLITPITYILIIKEKPHAISK